MIKLCIFDLDGTLVNSIYDLADSMNHALEKNGLSVHDSEKYRKMVGSGISVLADRVMGLPDGSDGGELKKAVLADFNKYYNVHCLDKTRPYEGIPELLKKLEDMGIKYSVLSNKPDIFSKRIISELFPEHRFASVWGKREGYERKPSPQAVLALTKELCTEPDSCLYIGDSDVDMYTAKNSCITSCGVEWGFRSVEELKAAGAEWIARKPDDIIGIISRLNGLCGKEQHAE